MIMSKETYKGWRAEAEVLKKVKEVADKNAQRVPGSGSGLDKGDIRLPQHNIELEVKHQKTIKLKEWWKQLQEQQDNYNDAALIVKLPQTSQYLAVVDLDYYLELVASQNEEVNVAPEFPPEMKFTINNLKRELNKFSKFLDNPS